MTTSGVEIGDVIVEVEDAPEVSQEASGDGKGEEKRKLSGDRTDSLIRKQMSEMEKEITRRSQNKNIKKVSIDSFISIYRVTNLEEEQEHSLICLLLLEFDSEQLQRPNNLIESRSRLSLFSFSSLFRLVRPIPQMHSLLLLLLLLLFLHSLLSFPMFFIPFLMNSNNSLHT